MDIKAYECPPAFGEAVFNLVERIQALESAWRDMNKAQVAVLKSVGSLLDILPEVCKEVSFDVPDPEETEAVNRSTASRGKEG